MTLDQLNREIKIFSLGYSQQQNRPVLIKESDLEHKSTTNLGQTASQMHLLVFMLPFIMAKYTDLQGDINPYWKCFMSLIEIMVICFSSKISTESVVYLRGIIATYLDTYKQLYQARITPKMHYLVHLPSVIMKFGPLIRCWCMRFEAKHSYFKDLSRKMKNFKNLPYSLVFRHQSMQYADNIAIDDQFDSSPVMSDDNNDLLFGAMKQVNDEQSITYIKNTLKTFYDIDIVEDDSFFTVNSVTIHGTLYKPGTNTYLNTQVIDDSPSFGRLMKIWAVNGNGIFFLFHMMNTLGFSEDLNAYEIADPDLPQGNEVLATSDLPNKNICYAYTMNNKLFIARREIIS